MARAATAAVARIAQVPFGVLTSTARLTISTIAIFEGYAKMGSIRP